MKQWLDLARQLIASMVQSSRAGRYSVCPPIYAQGTRTTTTFGTAVNLVRLGRQPCSKISIAFRGRHV